MRKIIIAIVALLLLGGGGAGAYFYFMKPAEASISEEEAGDHNEHAQKEDEKGGHGEHGAQGVFVELDPLILPIVDNTGVSQVVSMVIAIEVEDAANEELIKHMAPKLKDAFIQDMYGALNKHAALKGGVIQTSVLKERLNKVSQEIMGEGVVQDVLLQVVQQRPI
ncbi:MAG: flagellar basal body-associated FliL family protein [Alphaproteobacteria bacterium]|nr:flagellar basal body-associated FliL family protein [Alphaproteobacteria bacterium]